MKNAFSAVDACYEAKHANRGGTAT